MKRNEKGGTWNETTSNNIMGVVLVLALEGLRENCEPRGVTATATATATIRLGLRDYDCDSV